MGVDQLVTGGDVNDPVVDSLSTGDLSLTQGSAKIYQTADQTVSNSTITQIEFDSSDGNRTPGDILTVDLSNDKITIDRAGLYVIVGSVHLTNVGDGTRIIGIINVDSTAAQRVDTVAGGNATSGVSIPQTEMITNPPVDVIFETFQNSGGNLTTDSIEAKTNLQVVKLG